MDILWLAFLSGTGVYEIIPGFLCGGLAAVGTTLCTRKPSDEVEALFEKGISFQREAKQTKQAH